MKKNMNIVDKKFFNLVDEVKRLSFDELFKRIKLNYSVLPINIKNILENYFDRYDFWGSLNENKGTFDEIEKKAKVIKNHIDDFVWLYSKLQDYSSKFLLFAILNNWINYDCMSLKQTIDKSGEHYFDYNLIPHCKDEVFVDVGAYNGDTTLSFIKSYGEDSYKKIHCFEITPKVYDNLQLNLKNYKNIQYINKALRDKKGYVYIDENSTSISANRTTKKGQCKITCTSLDEEISGKVTMIKMDIEGDEKRAIKGCKQHIIKDTPKLLISIYHKNEHYFELARMINQYNKNYNFYLRNYGGELYPTEIVLFAIPKK